MILENEITVHSLQEKKKSYTGLFVIISFFIILALAWMVISPGVFTIHPTEAFPNGMTVIYFSRDSGMPLFSSPDSLCQRFQGSANLQCSAYALNTAAELANRVIFELPYLKWAYLKSTGGVEINQ